MGLANCFDLRVRRSLIFLAVCSALDELVTFRILSQGGVELNPKVAYLISINPLLYTLADVIIIASAYAADRLLTKRRVDTRIIWTAAGLVRLMAVALSLFN